MKIRNYIIVIIAGVIAYSCAVQKSPLGGERDETPPQLDTIKSTPNYITNFALDKVVLRFDEFIELKNAFEQVVYSPPMKTKPELLQRGKKLSIKFPEENPLRENTTYTINFGEAIVDLNESNPLTNFRYVFSTGDVIDSLSISGKVVDDITQEPAEDVLVMLYDNLNDSVVYTEQPYYFAKTNESGSFEIQNLRSDTFKVVVLRDGNLNLKYEEGEGIGFLDTFIYLTDSFDTPLSLNIFEPEIPLELNDTEAAPFRFKFEFSQAPDTVQIKSARDSIYWLREVNKDSIILWHDNTIPNDSFYVLGDTSIYKRRVSKTEFEPLEAKRKNLKRDGTLPIGQDIELEFSYAIQNIDESKFELSDTLIRAIDSLFLDSLNPRKLLVRYDFKFGDTMGLYVLPGALSFVNGVSNDSITELVIPESPEKYGTIYLNIDSLNQENQYLMQLMDGDKEVLSRLISEEVSAAYTFKFLLPKTYTVRLTLDKNRNGKWDQGSYISKSQSEEWQMYNLEELRENWELEAKVEWKE